MYLCKFIKLIHGLIGMRAYWTLKAPWNTYLFRYDFYLNRYSMALNVLQPTLVELSMLSKQIDTMFLKKPLNGGRHFEVNPRESCRKFHDSPFSSFEHVLDNVSRWALEHKKFSFFGLLAWSLRRLLFYFSLLFDLSMGTSLGYICYENRKTSRNHLLATQSLLWNNAHICLTQPVGSS